LGPKKHAKNEKREGQVLERDNHLKTPRRKKKRKMIFPPKRETRGLWGNHQENQKKRTKTSSLIKNAKKGNLIDPKQV